MPSTRWRDGKSWQRGPCQLLYSIPTWVHRCKLQGKYDYMSVLPRLLGRLHFPAEEPWAKKHWAPFKFSPATCKGSRFSCFIYSKAILPLLPFTANLDSVFPSKGDKNPAISHLSPDTSLGHPNRLTRLPLAGLLASPHPLPVSRQQLRHSSSKL